MRRKHIYYSITAYLAIIQALMVKVGDEKFAISLGSIQTIEDININEIKYVHAKEVIHFKRKCYSINKIKRPF